MFFFGSRDFGFSGAPSVVRMQTEEGVQIDWVPIFQGWRA